MLTKLRIKKLNKSITLVSKRIDFFHESLNDASISYYSNELSKIKLLINNQQSINKKQYHNLSDYLYCLARYDTLHYKKLFDLYCNQTYAELKVLGYTHDPDYEDKAFILDCICVSKRNIKAIEFLIQRGNHVWGDEKSLCDFRIKIGLDLLDDYIDGFKQCLDKSEHLKTYENALDELKMIELYSQKIKNIINETTNETDK